MGSMQRQEKAQQQINFYSIVVVVYHIWKRNNNSISMKMNKEEVQEEVVRENERKNFYHKP